MDTRSIGQQVKTALSERATESSMPGRPAAATSAEGIAMLHHVEQLRLKAYPDPASGGEPWTIGYGHTGPEVHRGLIWTEAQAHAAFHQRLVDEFEPGVLDIVKVPLAQHQFDALVCWVYNVGVTRARASTLVRLLNTGASVRAAHQFFSWKYAAGKDCSLRKNNCWGVWRRRHMENARFRGSTGAEAMALYDAMA